MIVFAIDDTLGGSSSYATVVSQISRVPRVGVGRVVSCQHTNQAANDNICQTKQNIMHVVLIGSRVSYGKHIQYALVPGTVPSDGAAELGSRQLVAGGLCAWRLGNLNEYKAYTKIFSLLS